MVGRIFGARNVPMPIQPGYINLVPVTKLPSSLADIRLSGIYHYYTPTRPGASFAMNPARPTATMLLTRGGVINRVK